MRSRGIRAALVVIAVATAAVASPLRAQTVYVHVGPPAPPTEVIVVKPGPAYVWVPGYHMWNGHAYVWVPGRWMVPPSGMVVWVPGHWVNEPRGWYWIEGHWRR